ncbi:hypothetical protein BJX63DRAFT_408788, partial [Aspergillus granulosus]
MSKSISPVILVFRSPYLTSSPSPRTHIAPVSEMNSFIQKAHTASASKSVVQPLASLLASIAISLLHL